TTNYDLFLESAIETSLEQNPRIFFNDGANGYVKRILNTDNFNKTLLYSGIFDNYSSEMPVINLIKCHGSINWKEYLNSKDNKPKIQITPSSSIIKEINQELSDFWNKFEKDIEGYTIQGKKGFSSSSEFIDLLNKTDIDCLDELIEDINELSGYSECELNKLVSKIENLQIVLPTKKKFQTTLIEEHYFNMLRFLSYELEKEQSTLIVFGFSFYDEHIADIVQRSLNNPNLIVIVFCYQNGDKEKIITRFNFSNHSIPKNIVFIEPDDFLIEEIDQEILNKRDWEASYYTFIKSKNNIKIYTREIGIYKGNSSEIPVLNFSSLNACLEEEFTNRFQPLVLNKEGEQHG
ncbi:hypothetical protein BTA30_20905, partial [Bacillus swezeyi]